ncbi:DegV family protein [Geomicrobium sp. JCM 19037]|uniref:DegV family protein n=1 Tax=unclassified Geomicrobium TaxID=2628951 RepID=UPI00045F422A|nr:DegV family protein [Geomicrobium sp. JCM 19037]GAK04668.1 DegV family protein [Geomicrobium sp. JCM 19037]
MTRVKIVTDSTADIPKDLVEELDITVIPLKVNFSEQETYLDGEELSPAQFYEKLGKTSVMPTTSQPSPYDFETLYSKISTDADEETIVFSIHLSSKLSGTYQAASIAAGEVEDKIRVHVIDSKKASYSIGIIVEDVARLAATGASAEQVQARIDELLESTSVYFLVETLEYLQKNGRIGKAAALIGSLLKMKPILSLSKEGEVYPFEKVRGRKKAIDKIVETLAAEYNDQPVKIGLSHAVASDVGDSVLETVSSRLNTVSTVKTEIGAVIGTHVGPGTIAIMVIPADENK